jgi:hypothetical protein
MAAPLGARVNRGHRHMLSLRIPDVAARGREAHLADPLQCISPTVEATAMPGMSTLFGAPSTPSPPEVVRGRRWGRARAGPKMELVGVGEGWWPRRIRAGAEVLKPTRKAIVGRSAATGWWRRLPWWLV